MSNSFRPYGLQPASFLCRLDSPGKNNGGGCHVLQDPGIETTSLMSPALAGCSLPTEPQGKPFSDKIRIQITDLKKQKIQFLEVKEYVSLIWEGLHRYSKNSCKFSFRDDISMALEKVFMSILASTLFLPVFTTCAVLFCLNLSQCTPEIRTRRRI